MDKHFDLNFPAAIFFIGTPHNQSLHDHGHYIMTTNWEESNLPEIAEENYVAGSLTFCQVELFAVGRPCKIEDKTGGEVSNLLGGAPLTG
jgi:hypothetical protein